MHDLTQKKCVPCEGGSPPASDEEIARLLPQVPRWQIVEVDGVKRLTKTFRFKDFVESVAFVNRVKDIAEAEGHHPDLHISWNTVRVENWTHAVKGLHENDFILAAKIDALAQTE
ncbi:MAG: 4a-hydroxytetrahydrobiopterin dehydratase [Candidatus Kerfeldbacteria bacterium]|nr:4a-hydroxytetrahydrobiopterin dehydratase [Candidatus Kerfeldbacteria bacterium]